MTDLFLLRLSGCGLATESRHAPGQVTSGLSHHARRIKRVSLQTEQDRFPLKTGGNDNKRRKDQMFSEDPVSYYTRVDTNNLVIRSVTICRNILWRDGDEEGSTMEGVHFFTRKTCWTFPISVISMKHDMKKLLRSDQEFIKIPRHEKFIII